ncbi:MAG: Integral membrane protein MviN [Parcubacteria group bacterium Gr01-1014_56]|nr:MAG: Integral membrane protein MviN [Parcubacteria group bacterium Gr01-1014_56]
MVRSFLQSVGLEVRGMHQAAYVLALFALGSQLLALVRDRLLAAAFGAGHTLDVYYAAFRIPDFLFATVASLLSLYALLPILSRLEREHESLVIAFMRNTLLLFFVAMAVVSGVAFVCTPWLVSSIAPGIAEGASRESLILLTRILLLQPILLGLSNLFANLTQLRHRFLLYSISPLFYNLGIIFGIVALYPKMGIAGLGWGVVIGALLHALVQAPFFFGEKTERRLSFKETFKILREVLVLSVPRTLSLAAGQITLLCLVALASILTVGSISIFTFASNLQAVPLTIIGVSYSVAAFPTLARFFQSGHREEFIKHIEGALRHIIFWAIPASVLIIVLRAHLVRSVLGAGAFDWSATRLTAAALALFVFSLLAQAIFLLIARAYYAAGNTGKPLFLAAVNIVFSVSSAIGLLLLFRSNEFFKTLVESLLRVGDVPGTSVLMLPLGISVGSLTQCLLGLWMLSRDFNLPLGGVLRLSLQSFTASIVGGVATYLTLQLFEPVVDTQTLLGIVSQGAVAGSIGLIATAGVLWLLKSKELAEIVGALGKKRLKSSEIIAVEPSDVA